MRAPARAATPTSRTTGARMHRWYGTAPRPRRAQYRASKPHHGMVCVIVDGVEWITTRDACRRLAPDVRPNTLRNWYAPRDASTPRVRLLRDPTGRPVRWRRQYLVAWEDVVEAEHATRSNPAGRPRRQT